MEEKEKKLVQAKDAAGNPQWSKEKVCIVDSAASMANHLEAVSLASAQTLELHPDLEGMPYVECYTDDGWPTDASVNAEEFSGAVMLGDSVRRLPALLAFENVLKHLPEGVAVLDAELHIRWCNDRLIELTDRNLPGQASPIGLSFHDAFGAPQIIGPDFSPFHTALGVGTTARTTYRVGDRTYFDVLAAPVYATGAEYPSLLVVTVRDISAEQLQGEKLTAIHQAGR